MSENFIPDSAMGPLNEDWKFFLANLPYFATPQDIRDHFQQFGVVNFCKLIFDPKTGKSRGYGFLYMNDSQGDASVGDFMLANDHRFTFMGKPRVFITRNDKEKSAASQSYNIHSGGGGGGGLSRYRRQEESSHYRPQQSNAGAGVGGAAADTAAAAAAVVEPKVRHGSDHPGRPRDDDRDEKYYNTNASHTNRRGNDGEIAEPIAERRLETQQQQQQQQQQNDWDEQPHYQNQDDYDHNTNANNDNHHHHHPDHDHDHSGRRQADSGQYQNKNNNINIETNKDNHYYPSHEYNPRAARGIPHPNDEHNTYHLRNDSFDPAEAEPIPRGVEIGGGGRYREHRNTPSNHNAIHSRNHNSRHGSYHHDEDYNDGNDAGRGGDYHDHRQHHHDHDPYQSQQRPGDHHRESSPAPNHHGGHHHLLDRRPREREQNNGHGYYDNLDGPPPPLPQRNQPPPHPRDDLLPADDDRANSRRPLSPPPPRFQGRSVSPVAPRLEPGPYPMEHHLHHRRNHTPALNYVVVLENLPSVVTARDVGEMLSEQHALNVRRCTLEYDGETGQQYARVTLTSEEDVNHCLTLSYRYLLSFHGREVVARRDLSDDNHVAASVSGPPHSRDLHLASAAAAPPLPPQRVVENRPPSMQRSPSSTSSRHPPPTARWNNTRESSEGRSSSNFHSNHHHQSNYPSRSHPRGASGSGRQEREYRRDRPY